ncbi:hypothetical protein ASD37_12255 [Mycobacterium sp. Root135]|nr:hypothetical protein ASD37_12255 [Mycobacterium sp. Root135]
MDLVPWEHANAVSPRIRVGNAEGDAEKHFVVIKDVQFAADDVGIRAEHRLWDAVKPRAVSDEVLDDVATG